MSLKYASALVVLENKATEDPSLLEIVSDVLLIPYIRFATLDEVRRKYFEYENMLYSEQIVDLCKNGRLDLALARLEIYYPDALLACCVALVDAKLFDCLEKIQESLGPVDYNTINDDVDVLDLVTNEATIQYLIEKGWNPIPNLDNILAEYNCLTEDDGEDLSRRVNKWILTNLTPEQQSQLHLWDGLYVFISWKHDAVIQAGKIKYIGYRKFRFCQ
jgi:hypothetical protein